MPVKNQYGWYLHQFKINMYKNVYSKGLVKSLS